MPQSRPDGTPEEELQAFAARFLASDAEGKGIGAMRLAGASENFVSEQFSEAKGYSLSAAQIGGLRAGADSLMRQSSAAGFEFERFTGAFGQTQNVLRDSSTGRFISSADAGGRLFTAFSR